MIRFLLWIGARVARERPSMRTSLFNENGWLDRLVDLHG
ncbi:hypothetical protein MMEU_0681 [Mycobacterium marinum str. Europe]|nr:hypothetical protein MMEU_0681 [Mycobacterium marinum str. Europe]